jgi:hypothetical protein
MVEEINTSDFQKNMNHKQGIVFFKDFWQRAINGNSG